MFKGKSMEDAFPISMMENRFNWKLEAKLPPNASSKRFFDLFINGKNFLAHYFAPMTESASNAMKGIITMNERKFLSEGQVFQWSSPVAQNGIQQTIGEEQKIEKLEIKDIECSTETLQ